MMRLLPFIGAAAVMVTLASCNTMSKEECQVADWRVVGDADGAAGYDPQARFAGHVDSCKKSGAMPNQTLWHEGYQVGIRRYCTPLSGAATGEANRGYYNVCPPELEGEFMRGYGIGKRVGELQSRVTSLENSMRTKEFELDSKEKQAKGEKDDRRRRELRDQMDDLDRDRRRMRRELGDLRYELEDAQGDLAYFRHMASLPPRG